MEAKPYITAKLPHPGSGVFFHQETRTVHVSLFTLCPRTQKCQKCARALATEGHCISPLRSISCAGQRVRVKTTAQSQDK